MPKRDAGRGRYGNVHPRIGTDGAPAGDTTRLRVSDVEYDEAGGALFIVVPSRAEKRDVAVAPELDSAVVAPHATFGMDRFDCSNWLASPKLATVFARSLARKMRPLRFRTRQADVEDLARGWFAFCASLPNAKMLDLPDLAAPLISRFVFAFLGAKDANGEYTLKSGSTRIHRLGAFRKVIDGLNEAERARLPPDFEIPDAPWRGAKLYTPTPPMDMQLAAKVYAYASKKVAATIAEVEAVWESAAEASACDPSASSKRLASGQHSIGWAYLRIQYLTGGYLPERKALVEDGGELFDLTRAYGYTRLARALAPMPSDLVPFIYLLAFQTVLNQQPLLDLTLDDITVTRVLGTPRVHIETLKYRANTVQRMNFARSTSIDSPYRTLAFLVRWTRNIRAFCDSAIKDDLFVYVPRDKHGQKRVETFHEHGRGKSGNFNALNTVFCRTAGFPWSGLRSIRALGAELANLIFGDDPAKQGRLIGHKSNATSEGHYTTQASHRRTESRLALAMEERARWVNSDGRVEPRGTSHENDRSAATPGFQCVDPFQSPLRGEHPGRLCQAYAYCPACPLAAVDVHSSYALARLLQLRERLVEARADMPQTAWKAKWQDVFTRLDTFWLPQFSDASVIAGAKTMTLPPLPTLD